jgi:hypothetical protein
MAYTFDGSNKLIIITAQVTMSVRDVYSRWVDWLALADNAKYLPAFETLGGNDIDPSSGTKVPIYAFLLNGWRIKPQESNHTLSVTDGVLLVQGGGDPFVNTLSSFVVRINYQQPVQAITVSTGGGAPFTAEDVADAILRRNLAGGSDGGRTVRDSLRASRNKTAIAGAVLTVYEEDDTTPAWTASIATGQRDAIQSIDPA